MNPISYRGLSRAGLSGVCLVLLLAASGCSDATGDPVAVALAPESHGALLLLGEIQGVEGLLLREGAGGAALPEGMYPKVAALLLDQALQVLGRESGPGSYSQEELVRIRRLVHGSREALEAGDYVRAIRRAYYACQLLGVEGL